MLITCCDSSSLSSRWRRVTKVCQCDHNDPIGSDRQNPGVEVPSSLSGLSQWADVRPPRLLDPLTTGVPRHFSVSRKRRHTPPRQEGSDVRACECGGRLRSEL